MVLLAKNLSRAADDRNLCSVEAMLGDGVKIHFECYLFVNEHIEAFGAMRGETIDIVEQHSCGFGRFVLWQLVSAPSVFVVVGIISFEIIVW